MSGTGGGSVADRGIFKFKTIIFYTKLNFLGGDSIIQVINKKWPKDFLKYYKYRALQYVFM